MLFLQVMTRHHGGGSSTARFTAEKAAVPAGRSLADATASSLQIEVKTLKPMLATRTSASSCS